MSDIGSVEVQLLLNPRVEELADHMGSVLQGAARDASRVMERQLGNVQFRGTERSIRRVTETIQQINDVTAETASHLGDARQSVQLFNSAVTESRRALRNLDSPEAEKLGAAIAVARQEVGRLGTALRRAQDEGDFSRVATAIRSAEDAISRTSDEADGLAGALGEIPEDANRAVRRLTDAFDDLRSSTGQAARAANVDLDEVADAARRATRRVDDLGDTADRAGRQVQGAFAAGFAGGIGALVTAGLVDALAEVPRVITGAVTGAVGDAADLVEAQGLTDRIFGVFDDSGDLVADFSGVLEEFASTSADQFGIAEASALQFGSQLGATLQNLGFATDDAAVEVTDLLSLSADMASAFNKDVPQAIEAVSALLRGETDPIEQFGVTINAAAIEAEALRLELADSVDDIDANAKATAALSLLYGQADGIVGDFALTAGGLPNLLRRIGASAQDLSADFGQALLPTVAAAASSFLALVQGDELSGAFDVLGEGLLENLTPVFDELRLAFEQVPGFVEGIAPDIADLVGAIGSIIADLAPTVLSATDAFVAFAAPIAEIAAGITAGLAPALTTIFEVLSGIGGVLGPVADVLGEVASLLSLSLIPASVAAAGALTSAGTSMLSVSGAATAARGATAAFGGSLLTTLTNPVTLAAVALGGFAIQAARMRGEADALAASIGAGGGLPERLEELQEELDRLVGSGTSFNLNLFGRDIIGSSDDQFLAGAIQREIAAVEEALAEEAVVGWANGLLDAAAAAGGFEDSLSEMRGTAETVADDLTEFVGSLAEITRQASAAEDPIGGFLSGFDDVDPRVLEPLAVAIEDLFDIDIGTVAGQEALEELIRTSPQARAQIIGLTRDLEHLQAVTDHIDERFVGIGTSMYEAQLDAEAFGGGLDTVLTAFEGLDGTAQNFVAGFLDANVLAQGTRFADDLRTALRGLAVDADAGLDAINDALIAGARDGFLDPDSLGTIIATDLDQALAAAGAGIDVGPVTEAVGDALRTVQVEEDIFGIIQVNILTEVTLAERIGDDNAEIVRQILAQGLIPQIQETLDAEGEVIGLEITAISGSINDLDDDLRTLVEADNSFTFGDGISTELAFTADEVGRQGLAVRAALADNQITAQEFAEVFLPSDIRATLEAEAERLGLASIFELDFFSAENFDAATQLQGLVNYVDQLRGLREALLGELSLTDRIGSDARAALAGASSAGADGAPTDIASQLNTAISEAEGFITQFVEATGATIEDLTTATTDAVGTVSKGSADASTASTEAFKEAGEAAMTAAEDIPVAIETIGEAFADFDASDFIDALDDLATELGGLDGVMDGVNRDVADQLRTFADLPDAAVAAFDESLVGGVEDAGAGAVSEAADIPSEVATVLVTPLDTVGGDAARAIGAGFAEAIGGVETAIRQAIEGLDADVTIESRVDIELAARITNLNAFASGLSRRIELALEAAYSTAVVNANTPGSGGTTIGGLPGRDDNIPLARGAIVSRATRALVGEGRGSEAVIPMHASLNRRAMSLLQESGLGDRYVDYVDSRDGGGGTTVNNTTHRVKQLHAPVNQTINVYEAADPKATAAEIAREHRERHARHVARVGGGRNW